MGAAKTSKKLEKNSYPPQKKLLKRNEIVLHQERQMPQFHKLLQNT